MSSIATYEGNIQEMFNSFTPTGMAQQTIRIEETKEEFLNMLNDEFGRNGLYFELEEKEFEFKGLVPALDIPNINLKFRGKQEKIGFLDPRTKALVHFCETNIEKVQEQIIQLKRAILKMQNEVKKTEDEIHRKRWNLFIRLFKKKSIIRLEVEARRLASEIDEIKFFLESRQSELDYENQIRERVMLLVNQLKEFGINQHAV